MRSVNRLPGSSETTDFSPKAAEASGVQPRLTTGIKRLDKLLGGGIPKGQISEIVGSPSSGKTGLLLSILARAVSQGEKVVYVDIFDSLDPSRAQNIGIDLNHFLWVRCFDWSLDERIGKALKAMDILVRSEGFGVLVLDLDDPTRALEKNLVDPVRKIPLNIWYRLKRIIQRKKSALVLLGHSPCSGSASSLVLGLNRSKALWNPGGEMHGGPRQLGLFRGIGSDAQLLRGKRHGHVEVYSDF